MQARVGKLIGAMGLLALGARPAAAHPGPHDGGAGQLLHAVTQPDHLLALLVIVAGAIWVPRAVRAASNLWRRRTIGRDARGNR